MTAKIINLKKLFHQHDYRYTEQRQAVLDIMVENSKEHLNTNEICLLLQQKGLNIGQSTVYRTLAMLEKLKLVRKLDWEDGYARYELCDDTSRAHHHLVCSDCGSVLDIEDNLLEGLENKIFEKYHFIVKDHCLKFFGECENCQNKKGQNISPTQG